MNIWCAHLAFNERTRSRALKRWLPEKQMAATTMNFVELAGVIALFAMVIFAGLEAMSRPRPARAIHNARRTAPHATRGSL